MRCTLRLYYIRMWDVRAQAIFFVTAHSTRFQLEPSRFVAEAPQPLGVPYIVGEVPNGEAGAMHEEDEEYRRIWDLPPTANLLQITDISPQSSVAQCQGAMMAPERMDVEPPPLTSMASPAVENGKVEKTQLESGHSVVTEHRLGDAADQASYGGSSNGGSSNGGSSSDGGGPADRNRASSNSKSYGHVTLSAAGDSRDSGGHGNSASSGTVTDPPPDVSTYCSRSRVSEEGNGGHDSMHKRQRAPSEVRRLSAAPAPTASTPAVLPLAAPLSAPPPSAAHVLTAPEGLPPSSRHPPASCSPTITSLQQAPAPPTPRLRPSVATAVCEVGVAPRTAPPTSAPVLPVPARRRSAEPKRARAEPYSHAEPTSHALPARSWLWRSLSLFVSLLLALLATARQCLTGAFQAHHPRLTYLHICVSR